MKRRQIPWPRCAACDKPVDRMDVLYAAASADYIWNTMARDAAARHGIHLAAESPDAPWATGSFFKPGFDDLQIKATEVYSDPDKYRRPIPPLTFVDDLEPENPPASPTPFLLGLIVGFVLGGDFVWIVWQLMNG